MKNKAQAAMDFLMTYGWVFVIILAALGAFSYFIGFDQSDKVPNSCNLGIQFGCGSYAADKDGYLVFEFTNLVGEPINITHIQFEFSTGIKQILNFEGQTSANLIPGERVVARTYPRSGTAGQLFEFPQKKEKILLTIYYKVDEEDSLSKNVQGEIILSIIDYTDEEVANLIPNNTCTMISETGTRTDVTISGSGGGDDEHEDEDNLGTGTSS